MSNWNKKVLVNAASSSLQVILVGIVYLFLYKYLLVNIGSIQLGVWSLVLATSSIANLANLGITSGMVKFIADYQAKNQLHLIGQTVYTAVVSLAVVSLTIAAVIFFSGTWILKQVASGAELKLAIQVLPLSVICLFVNMISGVFTSVMEGMQKNYIKNLIYSFSALLLLFSVYQLVPSYGLLGVGYAQAIQAFFVLFVSFLYSLRFYSYNIFFKQSWNKNIFGQLFRYGTKFQAISIAQMMYEPTTKLLLGKLGGMHFLGFYEMATRLVTQLRSVIVSANQVIIPVIAQAKLIDENKLSIIYKKSMSLLLFVSMVTIITLIIATPLISVLWIGYTEKMFIISIYIVSCSMFINIMCGPAYFSFLGEGNLKTLLVTHIVMAVLNLALGYLLGKWLGGNGVTLAWSITLSLGSFWCIIKYQEQKKITFSSIFKKKEILLLAISIVITSVYCVWIRSRTNQMELIKYAISFFVCLTPLFMINPNVKYIIRMGNRKA